MRNETQSIMSILRQERDHRNANTQEVKNERKWKVKPKGVVEPVNGLARFRLIIFWKNRPNKPVWIPSIDFLKGPNDKYYIDEYTSYKKLVYYITHTNYDKFTCAYIMVNLHEKPLWSTMDYNYCVYMNYKNQEKQRFKAEKINILHWKPKIQQHKNGDIVDRIKFIKENKLQGGENIN
jgi:hypothetical protein